MKILIRLALAAMLPAAAWLALEHVARRGAAPASGGAEKSAREGRIDLDFTRMNETVLATHLYRLAVNPKEFAGKTLRIAGTFLTRVDEDDGKRYFAVLAGEEGRCACCPSGMIVEFVPKASLVWPRDFPPAESPAVATGRLEMFEIETPDGTFKAARLVDAEVSGGAGEVNAFRAPQADFAIRRGKVV